MHHGHSCFQRLSSALPLAHRSQEMAYRYPLVLYSQHNSALHHYDNPVIHTVRTFGILVGPNNQGWLLLAQLH